MLKLMRRSLIAFLIGVLIAWAVPVLTELVAAAPGLAALTRAITAAGLPLAPVYFGLTNFFPALLFSFGVGVAMFRVMSGRRADLIVASAAPWLLNALYSYLAICAGTPVSCLGPFDLAGYAVVPTGLLLAALISKPPRLDTSLGGAHSEVQAAASPHVLRSGGLRERSRVFSGRVP